MNRIYLAGKVGGIKWRLAGPQHKPLHNVQFVASDGGNHSEHDWGSAIYCWDSEELRQGVEECFIYELEDCTGLIAVLDRPDSFGSIAEIAWAAARGIPCYVVIIESKRVDLWPESPMFDAYWFVTHFPGVVTLEANSEDEARAQFAGAVMYLTMTESPIERMLLAALIHSRVYPALQYGIGKYRVDMAFPDHMLAIEADGHDYHSSKEQKERDSRRDREIIAEGWRVVRFTGREIYRDAASCARQIIKLIGPRSADIIPQ